MPTVTQLQEFTDMVVVQNINNNCVYEDALAWIRSQLNPEDVFSTDQLEKWAESEGYIKAETQND